MEFIVTDAQGLDGKIRFQSDAPTLADLRDQFSARANGYGTYFLLRGLGGPDITVICTESDYFDDLEDGEYKVYIDADLVSENATRTEVLHLVAAALDTP